MPKIPESSAIQVPRVATPSGRLDAMSINTIDRTIQQGFALAKQYKQQQQKSELVKISTEMDRKLLDLQLEIEQNPEFNSAEAASQAYVARAKPIIEQATAGSNWKSVQTAVGARGASASLRGVAATTRTGYAREVDAARAILGEDADTAVQKYVMAEDDIGRAAAISQFQVNLEMESHIGEVERVKRLDRFDADRVNQRTIHLSNQGQFSRARAYLEDPEATSVLDPDDIYRLHGTINQAEARQEAGSGAADKALSEALAKDAFLSIQAAREAPALGPQVPAFGLADFEEILPYLTFEHAKAVRSAMEKQYVVENDNPDELIRLHGLIDSGDTSAGTQITNAYAADLIKRETYGDLRRQNAAANDDPVFGLPYKEARNQIEEALGPLKFETRAGLNASASLRTNRALRDLQRFRETRPEATQFEIFAEQDRLINSYFPLAMDEMEGSLAIPYGSESKEAARREGELDRAALGILTALEFGQIDDRRAADEEMNLRRWRELLDRQAARAAATAARKANQ